MRVYDSTYSPYNTTDEDYPLGKWVDASTPETLDGSPILASLVNQLLGSQQALLRAARGENLSGTLTGTPDTAQSSDFLSAMIRTIYNMTATEIIWQAPQPGYDYEAIAVRGDRIAAVTHDGEVSVSTDSGATWTHKNTSAFILNSVVILASRRIVAAGRSGPSTSSIQISDNDGSNWTSSTLSGIEDTRSIIEHNGRLVVGCNSGQLAYSPDDGNNWTVVTSPLSNVQWYRLLSAGSKLYAVTDDPVAAPVNIITSEDDGASWTSVTYPFPISRLRGIAMSGGRIIAKGLLVDRLIYSDDGGASWVNVASDISANLPSLIGATEVNNTRLVNTDAFNKVIQISPDRGDTWIEIDTDDVSVYGTAYDDGRFWFCGYDGKIGRQKIKLLDT